jgi:hypothetical protein
VEERKGNRVKHQQNYERFTDNYRLGPQPAKPKDTSQSEAQTSAYAKKADEKWSLLQDVKISAP